jgi:hypothetical protein
MSQSKIISFSDPIDVNFTRELYPLSLNNLVSEEEQFQFVDSFSSLHTRHPSFFTKFYKNLNW